MLILFDGRKNLPPRYGETIGKSEDVLYARLSAERHLTCVAQALLHVLWLIMKDAGTDKSVCATMFLIASSRSILKQVWEDFIYNCFNMHPLLLETAHRPIALPSAQWIMKQKWHDLLFAHWPLPPEKLRPLVPQQLELDLRDGQAWVAVVPFWMSGIRGRWAPPLPFFRKFCELNVRTYVRHKGVPGVYFFSLDAASLPAVLGARATYKLPYFHAAMLIRSSGESFEYTSSRLQEPRPADFHARYWPVSSPSVRDKGSIESFLTERYCLYTVDKGRVLRAYIHHAPWQLQDAEAEFDINTVAKASRIELPETRPLLHFSRILEVLVWWPEKI